MATKPNPKPKGTEVAIDPEMLRRRNRPKEEDYRPVQEEYRLTAGVVDRVLDYVVNPSRDAIRGVTSIDKMQGRLFPLLDTVNAGRAFCLEVATFRQDKEMYRKGTGKPQPVIPNLVEELLFRIAQWQRSVGGMSYNKAMEVVMTEVESRAEREDMSGTIDGWKE